MDSAIRYIKKKISSSYITKRIRPSSQPEPNIDEKYFILAENQKWKKKPNRFTYAAIKHCNNNNTNVVNVGHLLCVWWRHNKR